MARKSYYDIKVENLMTAIGVKLPDYKVPEIEPLVNRVIQRLQQMIATGAPDSETGDVVDPIIDAWVTEKLALLDGEKPEHDQAAEELIVQANALALDARRLHEDAVSTLGYERQEHDRITAELDALDTRRAGRL